MPHQGAVKRDGKRTASITRTCLGAPCDGIEEAEAKERNTSLEWFTSVVGYVMLGRITWKNNRLS